MDIPLLLRRMQVDLVSAAQEGGHAFVEQVGHRGRQAGEDKTDGKSVLNEVLDAGGQLSQFSPVGGVDFVHGDDQARATTLEEPKEFFGEFPPPDLAFRRQYCREAETSSGHRDDLAPLRPLTQLFGELAHGFTDPAHEATGGRRQLRGGMGSP